MATLTITAPGNKTTNPQKFNVSGRSDAAEGAQVSCTISKGPFNETQFGRVDQNQLWSVSLGVVNPIPVDTDYAITAKHTDTTGSDGVSEIAVSDKPPIVITDIKIAAIDAAEELLVIRGRVGDKVQFNSLSVLCYEYGLKGPPHVYSSGWIKPIPESRKWEIKLKAPTKGHKVIHVLGIKSEDDNTGYVVARVTQAVKK